MLFASCLLLSAKSQEPSTLRAKSPPSSLLSKKKVKFSEKRESEPRRRSKVHKSLEEVIFQYAIFWRKNNSLQCWVSSVSFFLFGGRLLNRNILDDIWSYFHLLLSPLIPLSCSCLNWADCFLLWSELYFCVCVCVDSLVLSLSTVCVDSLVLSLSTVCVCMT